MIDVFPRFPSLRPPVYFFPFEGKKNQPTSEAGRSIGSRSLYHRTTVKSSGLELFFFLCVCVSMFLQRTCDMRSWKRNLDRMPATDEREQLVH